MKYNSILLKLLALISVSIVAGLIAYYSSSSIYAKLSDTPDPEPEPNPDPSELCFIEGDGCDDNGGRSCCTGLSCINNICYKEKECGENGDPCDSNHSCCGELQCIDGICSKPIPECGDIGDSCSIDSDCCVGYSCNDGVCGIPIPPPPTPTPTCGGDGSSCNVKADCCSNYNCLGGKCIKSLPPAKYCQNREGGMCNVSGYKCCINSGLTCVPPAGSRNGNGFCRRL